MFKKTLLATAVLVGSVTVASAASVTIDKDLTNPYKVPQIDTFETTGANMTGLGVTAYFGDGTSQTLTWATTGASTTLGGVSSSRFSLSVDGNTFSANWNLSSSYSSSMTSLLLSGSSGNTLFDTTAPEPGTTGSARGWNFADTSSQRGDITATYSGVVGLGASAPIGDVFSFLLVDFTSMNDGGLSGRMTFRQDTDNGAGGPIAPVPIPASLPLLLGGIAAFGAVSRRRRQKAS